jgi:hypothetical protein
MNDGGRQRVAIALADHDAALPRGACLARVYPAEPRA